MGDVITVTIGDDPPDMARLKVSVHPKTSENTFNEIELVGNRDGLIWLAKQILEIANKSEEIHTHLDREACSPIYESTEDWWITIDRNDRLRRKTTD
jgi:hypothetical protein